MAKSHRKAKRAPLKRRRLTPESSATSLQYKVVELSSVDEVALERTINQWVARRWSFDGVQFAMRESSKRPTMAFVLFTRQVPVKDLELESDETPRAPAGTDDDNFTTKRSPAEMGPRGASNEAWRRLASLANPDDAERA
jgi:hypothetical protein